MLKLKMFFLISFFSVHICTAASVIQGTSGSLMRARVVADFNEPWAMTFINEKELLVTSKTGKLWVVSVEGNKSEVSGVPKVAYGGQGGLGDVILHPNFKENQLIYFSYIKFDDASRALRGAVVASALFENSPVPRLKNIELIWEQSPKLSSLGHYSHRLVFGPVESKHHGKLFITSGDRQDKAAAQDLKSSLGKVIRINHDGTVPNDNPFQEYGELAKSFWTLGHRNALGIAFDSQGNLWAHEMGPKHGDELNLIEAGKNYGWPLVSEGSHYNGEEIPSHSSQPRFRGPILSWVPTIAPSSLIFYAGKKFRNWNGSAFIGGLKSRALIRLGFADKNSFELERFEWGRRVREVELGSDGSIWVLEDPPLGRLIQFNPVK
ncbi:MAG: glucose dehydrogenase [Rhodobacteraceae bacterium]|nr:MAG: glucose dehydrogenase [Paracoccaceae bacterium]